MVWFPRMNSSFQSCPATLLLLLLPSSIGELSCGTGDTIADTAAMAHYEQAHIHPHPHPSHKQTRRSSSRNSQRPTMLPLIRLDISPDKYLSSCRLSVGESAINAALMCAQFFRLARAALARRSLICAPIVWATTRYERLGRHTAKSNTPAIPINIALRLPRRGPSRRLATITTA